MPSLREGRGNGDVPATAAEDASVTATSAGAVLVQGTPIRKAGSGGLYGEGKRGEVGAGGFGGVGGGDDGADYGDGLGVGSEIGGKSIYDAWNDDDYEELA